MPGPNKLMPGPVPRVGPGVATPLTLFHVIQVGNKSLLYLSCLLITRAFRHKETLQGY